MKKQNEKQDVLGYNEYADKMESIVNELKDNFAGLIGENPFEDTERVKRHINSLSTMPDLNMEKE